MSATTILGIESSCDDTGAAVIRNGILLSNIISNQSVHQAYGGVVPELASRAHQQNIIPVVAEALKRANITKKELSAVAFTQGPGLMGPLLVGASFAKAFALGLQIPLIEVNHMQGHVLAHFIQENPNVANPVPSFPFLCLTVSGGHTQIVLVKDYMKFEVIGETTDDAAGEAFDKVAKILGFPYPGGPLVDKYAKQGNANAFAFPGTAMAGLDFSFSGIKTAFLYFMREATKKDPDFIEKNTADICASIQSSIVKILMDKIKKAADQTGIKQIAIAGGVSANSGLRAAMVQESKISGWTLFIPRLEYCTDNAAMIAMTAHFKFLHSDFASQKSAPSARLKL
jgi:N6-L-threonylcarbamoyladenine synthase